MSSTCSSSHFWAPSICQAQTSLLAVGTLDKSRAGEFQDLSGLTYPLENGVRANELGGFGWAIANAGGYTFLQKTASLTFKF